MALAIAGAASEKKALDITIMKMRKVSSVCDYFVIASGASTTQVNAISENIEKRLKEKGEKLLHIEGEREASWILLDYGDVVCHVFLDETRRFYGLERLWRKAPQERFEELPPRRAAGRLRKTRKTARKAPISRRRKKRKA